MHLRTSMVAIAIAVALGGCGNLSVHTDHELIEGAVIGEAGSTMTIPRNGRFVATLMGTFIHSPLGQRIGRELDERDIMLHETAIARTMIHGWDSHWENPRRDHSGYTYSGQYSPTSSGGYCREYYESILIDGNIFSAQGVICRLPNGSWYIAN